MDDQRALARRTVVIPASWALIGKDQGSREDFGILAASAADIDIRELSATYLAGVPSADMDMTLPSAPPWVTFGVHGSAGGPLVSVTVQRRWEGLDQAGRPIWPRDFFVCRYTDLAEHGVSYEDLYTAIAGIDLRLHDPGPARLNVPSRPEQIPVAYLFNGFGLESVAVIAAALLDGPVAVTATAGLHLQDRLRLLDAVAALLPYGYRAGLSASTAVSGSTLPRMRLVFTERPSDTQQLTGLSHPILPSGPEGALYFQTLREKLESQQEKLQALRAEGENAGIDHVLRYLWEDKSPQNFEPAGRISYALARLRMLDWEDDLIRKIRLAPVVTPSLAGQFFEQDVEFVDRHWPYLQAKQVQLAEAMLNSGRPDAAPALVKHWYKIAPRIIAVVNDRLDSGDLQIAERSLEIAGYGRSAEAANRADGLLSRLMAPPGEGTGLPWADRMVPRIDLLTSLGPASLRGYPETREFLRYHSVADGPARLVFALLTRDKASARDWAEWLSRPLPVRVERESDWAIALDYVTGSSREPDAVRSLRETAAVAPSWIALYIQLARLFRRQGLVLDTLSDELIRQARAGSADAGPRVRRPGDGGQSPVSLALAAALRDGFRPDSRREPHAQAPVPEETLARVDAARVLLGLPPVDFFSDRPEGGGAYRASLDEVLRSLPETGWDEPLQRKLQQDVLWVDEEVPRPAPRSVGLIKAWCHNPRRLPALAEHIGEYPDDALARALYRSGQLSPDDWDLLAGFYPKYRKYGTEGHLRLAVQRAIADPDAALETRTVIGSDGDGLDWVALRSGDLVWAMFKALTARTTTLEECLTIIWGTRGENGSRNAGKSLPDVVPPDKFWALLAELQRLLVNYPGDNAGRQPERPHHGMAGSAGTARAARVRDADRDWWRAVLFIGWGDAFGAGYGQRFRQLAERQSELAAEAYVDLGILLGTKRLSRRHQGLLRDRAGLTLADLERKRKENHDNPGHADDEPAFQERVKQRWADRAGQPAPPAGAGDDGQQQPRRGALTWIPALCRWLLGLLRLPRRPQ
jgi:hypothetical protein